MQDLLDHFYLPHSKEAFFQYLEVSQLVSNLHLHDFSDLWSYIWGSAIFSTKKAYAHLSGSPQVHSIF